MAKEQRARIYNFDPKKDGWKKLPDAPLNDIKIDQKLRGIRAYKLPETHYFKNGKSFCGLDEVPGTTFYNDPKTQTCSKCKQGVREQTKAAKRLEERAASGEITSTEAEKDNVVDYKAAEAEDHPETATVSH